MRRLDGTESSAKKERADTITERRPCRRARHARSAKVPAPMGPRAPYRMTGTVQWYNAEKRFGFVAVEGGRKEVFVHAATLQRSGIASLSEGQRVAMEVAEGRKGLEALAVSLRD
jgi:cold shock CspA family protein